MKNLRPLFLIILSSVAPLCFAQTGQQPDRAKPASGLKALNDLLVANGVVITEPGLTASAGASGVQEIHVRWDAYAATSERMLRATAAPRPAANFSILSRRQLAGSLPVQRAPELSSEEVLVVAVDEQAQLRGWALIADPRIVRYESASTTGELSGQILYRATPEFLVALPDDRAITEVRLYHPRWTGDVYVLDALGKISLQ